MDTLELIDAELRIQDIHWKTRAALQSARDEIARLRSALTVFNGAVVREEYELWSMDDLTTPKAAWMLTIPRGEESLDDKQAQITAALSAGKKEL